MIQCFFAKCQLKRSGPFLRNMCLQSSSSELCDWYVRQEIQNVFPRNGQWREKYLKLSKETQLHLFSTHFSE